MWATANTLKTFMLGLICLGTQLFTSHGNVVLEDIFSTAVAQNSPDFNSLAFAVNPDWASTLNISSWNQSCLAQGNNYSALRDCLTSTETCLTLKDLTQLYGLDPSKKPSVEEVNQISPGLILALQSCSDKRLNAIITGHEKDDDVTPSSEESWGYSFLFVTLINFCSLTGAVVFPCMKFKSYKLVLMFMVALAVGTLAGSGLLFLIPEAFMLVHNDDSDYIWKSSAIMGGIYLFYMTEKIMRMINARREDTNLKKKKDEMATEGTITMSFRRIPIDNSIAIKDPANIPDDCRGICSPFSHSSSHSSTVDMSGPKSLRQDEANSIDDIDVSVVDNGGGDTSKPISEKPMSNGHSHHGPGHSHVGEVAPVAYMIIFGDALHNFIDGLSIGSAFTQSILTGISVSVAVMCEELPHELGDFAILLNSGMPFKRAIMYNFLSSCTCYLGTVIGILLGENTSSHEWIFAVAGGMFLYISLVDMMPEMNSAAESAEGKEFGEIKTFLLQNLGLLTGFGCMLLFAVYGGNISFE